jgi:hypothetical protein
MTEKQYLSFVRKFAIIERKDTIMQVKTELTFIIPKSEVVKIIEDTLRKQNHICDNHAITQMDLESGENGLQYRVLIKITDIPSEKPL